MKQKAMYDDKQLCLRYGLVLVPPLHRLLVPVEDACAKHKGAKCG